MVKQGDIIWIDFNPSKGHEQKSHRPAVILSNDLVTKTSNMTIVAPISNTKRNYPMYYPVKRLKTEGKILLDQTRALDLIARNITDDDVIERIPKDEFQKIIHLYKLLFDINEHYD